MPLWGNCCFASSSFLWHTAITSLLSVVFDTSRFKELLYDDTSRRFPRRNSWHQQIQKNASSIYDTSRSKRMSSRMTPCLWGRPICYWSSKFLLSMRSKLIVQAEIHSIKSAVFNWKVICACTTKLHWATASDLKHQQTVTLPVQRASKSRRPCILLHHGNRTQSTHFQSCVAGILSAGEFLSLSESPSCHSKFVSNSTIPQCWEVLGMAHLTHWQNPPIYIQSWQAYEHGEYEQVFHLTEWLLHLDLLESIPEWVSLAPWES